MPHTIRRTPEGYLYCTPRLRDILAAFASPAPALIHCPATPLAPKPAAAPLSY